MAILVRQTNGRRKFKGLPYLFRPTRGKTTLVYKSKRYRKVFESLDTDTAYKHALRERKKRPAVWTGERVREGRTYGVFVRRHVRRQPQGLRIEPAGPDYISGTQDVYIGRDPVGQVHVEIDPIDKTHASIAWLSVRGDVRKRGYGRLIVEQVLDDLRTKDVKLVTLVAQPEAVGFWERMGFRTVEPFTVTGGRQSLQIMERHLTPNL